MNFRIFGKISASLAQLVEQLIRNEQVVGSSPIGGSSQKSIKLEDPDKQSFVRVLLRLEYQTQLFGILKCLFTSEFRIFSQFIFYPHQLVEFFYSFTTTTASCFQMSCIHSNS